MKIWRVKIIMQGKIFRKKTSRNVVETVITTGELCEELVKMGYNMGVASVQYARVLVVWQRFVGSKETPVAHVNTSKLGDYSTSYPWFRDELDIEQKMALTLLLDEYGKTPLRYR